MVSCDSDPEISRSRFAPGLTTAENLIVAPSATFSSAPTAAGASDIDIAICTASVNSTTGERKVWQFVTSAIVIGGSGDANTVYDCDGHSITRSDYSESDSSTLPGSYFYLNGFGKFTIGNSEMIHGFYSPPTVAELEMDSDETDFAVVCRTGNSSQPNANGVSYKKLKLKGSGSSPFQYTKTTTTNAQTNQSVTTHKLVNCCFYWDGVLQSLSDYDVSGLLSGGTVYLRGTQDAPSVNDHQPSWTWTLGTSAQQAPNGGKVLNFKLYDFAQSKVAVDYRTTFLAMVDHTPKDVLIVGDPNGAHIELASTRWANSGASPGIALFDSSGRALGNGGFSSHFIQYKNSGGTTNVVYGLLGGDIDLTHLGSGGGGSGGGSGDELPDIDVVTDISFAIVSAGGSKKIQATLSRKNIKSGEAASALTRDVCTLGELDVVTGSEYSTSTHTFKNKRKNVAVVGSPTNVQDADVFTATPQSRDSDSMLSRSALRAAHRPRRRSNSASFSTRLVCRTSHSR